MIRFFKKIILFSLIFFGILEIFSTLILSSDNKFTKKLLWYRSLYVNYKSTSEIKSDTIYLGCSVGYQLFPAKWAENYMAAFGSTYFAGNYMIANNVLENNPSLKCIIFVVHPAGICYKFERKLTYGYFLKPFYTYQNLKYFDTLLIRKIAQKPLALMGIFNFVKLLPLDDINYYDDVPVSRFIMTDFSLTYLKKILHFAKTNDIELIFVSPHLNEVWKDDHRIPVLKYELNQYGLDSVFHDYFENMVFLPDTCFRDLTHLKTDFVHYNRKELLKMLKQINK